MQQCILQSSQNWRSKEPSGHIKVKICEGEIDNILTEQAAIKLFYRCLDYYRTIGLTTYYTRLYDVDR